MKNLLIAVAALVFGGTVWAAAPAPAPAAPAAPAPAKPEEFVTKVAKGEAAIVNGDKPAAHEKALQAALREAVNQVVGTFVTSQTETKDFTMVRDIVFAHTEGYVRSYTELKKEEADDVLTVTVQAEVGKGAVDRDVAAIKTIIGMRGQRRVYVAITDVSAETQGKASPTTAVVRHGQFDGVLREALRGDGFTCLDPNIVDGKLKSKAGIQSLSNPQEATEIGNLVGADIVIYGNATASQTEGEVGTKIYKVPLRVTISIATTDSGESLADVVQSEDSQFSVLSYADAATKSMKVAAEKATAAVRAKLYEAWRKQLTGAQHVSLTVNGLRDFGAYSAFKELMRAQVRGVKDLYSARFEKGSASMELALTGSVDTLAAELAGKNFKGQIIQVTKSTNNTLELALGK